MQRKQSPTGRFAAVEILCRLYQERSSVKTLLDSAVFKYHLPANERNLAMQLVYGTLRNRQYLDRILQILSKTPLAKIDPFIHQILAVGLYQLFFLQRIPQSAAVNEMVECCKTGAMPKRLEGFVNGILRQSIRQMKRLVVEATREKTGEPIVNHPQWLVNRWRGHFGDEETQRICEANNREPLLVLRTNSEKIARDVFRKMLDDAGIVNHAGTFAAEAVALPEFHGSITTIPGYAEGLFQVQDEAAQLASSLLGPFRAGGRYLDGCAGLGGKTSHLLQYAANNSLEIHAIEPETYRLHKLRENLRRTASKCQPVIHATTLQEFELGNMSPFDGILIDAPCSGTGVTGRHPDIRWNRRPEDLLRYPEEQLSILTHSADLLASGGTLVYATCSLEPEENEEVVTAFLRERLDFQLTDCTQHLPDAARRFVVNGCFAPRPEASIDGFFAARMQRC